MRAARDARAGSGARVGARSVQGAYRGKAERERAVQGVCRGMAERERAVQGVCPAQEAGHVPPHLA
ncbi:hypothetical protein E6C60_1098 [Paenibacillus algicola]|uniref:Uncharacterized protein n=1 Tax=Paenibacillus algicola TaxID=2565926 RepID=A0A4P8XH38_9BACL|nr:hypothetical protein E6C60_1098 [Paenibacillus algicola]